MANTPSTPASFTQYLASHPEVAAAFAAPAPQKTNLKALGGSSGTGAVSGNAQTPLSWLTDIISRPLYGIEAIAKHQMLAGAQAQANQLKGKGPGQALVDLGAAQNPLTMSGDFLRGVFSDAPGDHETTSQLEEDATDAYGANDPKYKNVKDNVNPILKGITGFVGDIALDPLTYVPGPDVLTIGRKIVKGVGEATKALVPVASDAIKAGAQVVKDARSGSEVTSATEKLLQDAGEGDAPELDLVTQKPYSVVGHNGHSSFVQHFDTKEEADNFAALLRNKHGWTATKGATAKTYGKYRIIDNAAESAKLAEQAAKETEKLPAPIKAEPVPEAAVIPVSVGDQMRANPRSKAMVSILDDLNKVSKKRPVVLPSATTGEASTALNPQAWLNEHIKLAVASTDHASVIRVKNGPVTQSVPLEDVPNILKRATPLRDVLQGEIQKRYLGYREAFAKAANDPKNPHAVDAISRPVVPTKLPKKGPLPTETLVSQLQRFQEVSAQQQERVEGAFGTDLMGQLQRMKNPDRFQAVTKSLSDMLKRTDDLSDVSDFTGNPAMSKLFKALGIDPGEVNAARRQAVSGVGKQNVMDDPIIDRIKDPKLGAQLSDVDKDVVAALPAPLQHDFIDLGRYEHVTKTGTRKTDEGIGEGLGRDDHAINTHAQWNIFHSLSDIVTERAKTVVQRIGAKPGLAGVQRAAYVQGEVMQRLTRAEQLFDSHGMPMFLDYAGERLPLSFGQALDVMGDGYARTLQQTLFNGANSIPTTNVMDAIFMAVKKDATWDDVDAQLEKVALRNGKEGEIPNPLSDGHEAQFGFLPANSMSKANQSEYLNGVRDKWLDPATGNVVTPLKAASIPNAQLYMRWVPRKGGFAPMYQAGPLRGQLTTAIISNVQRMKDVAGENAASYASRLTSETLDLTDDQVAQITMMVNDPTKIADALQSLATIDSRVSKEALVSGTLEPSAHAATEITEAAAPEGAVGAAKDVTKIVKKQKKASADGTDTVEPGKGTAIATAEREAKQVNDDAAAQGAEDDPQTNSFDWKESARANREANSLTLSKIDPIKSAFNPMFNQDLYTYELGSAAGATLGELVYRYRAELTGIQKQFGGIVEGTQTPILRQAFQDLQNGVVRDDPTLAAATQAVKDSMGKLVDVTGEAPILGHGAFRMNTGIDHLNERLRNLGLPEIDIDMAIRDGNASGRTTLEEAADQWKKWEIDDPINFMATMHTAMVRLATDHSTGIGFYREGLRQGWVSHVYKKGFVKVRSTAGSAVADALPRSDWYDPEHLGYLRQLDEVMHSSSQIGGKFGKFTNEYLDPIQQAWKKGVTIYHVGHHTRNLTGDQSSTFLAEGTASLRRSVADAFKVQAVRGNYTDVDVFKSLDALGETTLPRTGDIISSGRYGDLTVDDIWAAAMQKGLIRRAATVEAIGPTGTGAFSSVLGKLSLRGTKLESAAMTVSEYREHYSRLQHFIQIIHNQQKGGKAAKSLDTMLDEAAHRVKRFHPDRSMLTPFEKKYMARLFPFYTWFRGMLPAIAESVALHPGRVNAFNKATYNLAVANGIDPNSLSDPFPTDQLFPSFLTDQFGAGPVAKFGGAYFGISPGIASQDVINQFSAGNPARNALGMLTPMISSPIEAVTMKNLSTGGDIHDLSDFIDSQIPGVNYLSNFTGTSVTGSIASGLQGKGLDPQYQVTAGNKTSADYGVSAFNWLTGLGLQNMSKQNYINYAEIEQRNAAGAAKTNASTF